MIIIEKSESTKVKVEGIYSLEEVAVEFDTSELPVAEDIPGKTAELFYNKETKQLAYEYIDRPLTEQERLQGLEESQGNHKATYFLSLQCLKWERFNYVVRYYQEILR